MIGLQIFQILFRLLHSSIDRLYGEKCILGIRTRRHPLHEVLIIGQRTLQVAHISLDHTLAYQGLGHELRVGSAGQEQLEHLNGVSLVIDVCVGPTQLVHRLTIVRHAGIGPQSGRQCLHPILLVSGQSARHSHIVIWIQVVKCRILLHRAGIILRCALIILRSEIAIGPANKGILARDSVAASYIGVEPAGRIGIITLLEETVSYVI